MQTGTVLNNYAHIFDILIRLRQAVDHPYLVIYSESPGVRSMDLNQYEMSAAAQTMLTTTSATAGVAYSGNGTTPSPRSTANLPSTNGKNTKSAKTTTSTSVDHADKVCSICHDPMENSVTAACGHGFCYFCIVDYISTMGESVGK